MFSSFITLVILFIILKYILAWIDYFNKLDDRLGDSLWRWSYDYHVLGERDISDLDDKEFVRLRRKRNEVVTYMYIIFFIMFFISMWFLSEILIFCRNCFAVIELQFYSSRSVDHVSVYCQITAE